jgi:hypothetical protein
LKFAQILFIKQFSFKLSEAKSSDARPRRKGCGRRRQKETVRVREQPNPQTTQQSAAPVSDNL